MAEKLKHDQTIPPYIRTLHKPLQPLSNLIFSPVAHFTPIHPIFPHNISNPLKSRSVNFVGTLLTLPLFGAQKNTEQSLKSPVFSRLSASRCDKIRTCGLCVPNAALYQTEPRLDITSLQRCCSFIMHYFFRIVKYNLKIFLLFPVFPVKG